MKRKIIGFNICIMLISTVVFLPVAHDSVNAVLMKKIGKMESSYDSDSLSNKDEISVLFEQMISNILNNRGSTVEISELLSYQEIKDAIREISDEETLDAIEILFSDKEPLFKFLKIHRFSRNYEEKRRSYGVEEIEVKLNKLMQSNNITSLANNPFLSEFNISSENITSWYSGWESFLEGFPHMRSIIQKNEFNLFRFFVIFIVCLIVWSFLLGGLNACFPPQKVPWMVMGLEAYVLGAFGAWVLGVINVTGKPLITWLVEKLCEIHPPLARYEESLKCVIGYLIGTVILSVYAVLFLETFTFRFLGGGLFVVVPPLIVALVAESFKANQSAVSNEFPSINQIEIRFGNRNKNLALGHTSKHALYTWLSQLELLQPRISHIYSSCDTMFSKSWWK